MSSESTGQLTARKFRYKILLVLDEKDIPLFHQGITKVAFIPIPRPLQPTFVQDIDLLP